MNMKLLMPLGGLLVASSVHAAQPDVAPVDNALYAKECGACHFAYPPGLLPARSWQKLFAQLDKHFGENAELAADDVKALTAYTMSNAADKVNYSRSKKIAASINKADTPLRITDTTYIRNKHHEIPRRMLQDNPEVKSLSKCNACHVDAAKGSFDEDAVRIPGFGAFKD